MVAFVEFSRHFPSPVTAHVQIETSDGSMFSDTEAAYEHSKFLFMVEALRVHFNLPEGSDPQETCASIMKKIAKTGDVRSVDDVYDRMLRIITTEGKG